MTVARLCRGRTLAVVLGANLLFLGLLLAFQGVKVDVESSQTNTFLPQDTQAIYRLPKGSASLIKAKYFRLREGKFCNFLNSEPSRSLMYKECVCSRGFYGVDCGIPHFIWSQLLLNGTKPMTLKRLQEPRRVIEFKFSAAAAADASPVVQNVTVCSNASAVNASLESFHREVPDLQVYTGPVQANFSCASPRIVAFSCSSLLCCWNRFWMLASELSFTDLVVIDIGEASLGPTLPGDLLEFFKFYQGFPEVLMIKRGPSVSVVASFNSIAVECNFDIKCIASCESSQFQVISLDL